MGAFAQSCEVVCMFLHTGEVDAFAGIAAQMKQLLEDGLPARAMPRPLPSMLRMSGCCC